MKALSELRWRPISTVPRNGPRVLVLMRGQTIDTACYNEHSIPRATHWIAESDLLALSKED